jgi:hypothetical protein
MSEDGLARVERRPSTVDLSWFLDLEKNSQLDLNPSYQRRSVWTPNDRRYFLDTIFRNYPSPAIFLHKSIEDDGAVTYHVVDGKQRISTIILFAANKISLPKEFGDSRLDGKRWRDLDPIFRRVFWNYPIPIEQIDALQAPVIKDVFARLNKNSRKLTRQELRHARFDGWFITFVETEALGEEWKLFKIRTTAKEKRMLDIQNLSELAQIVIRADVVGFDQFALDELYAAHEEADSEESDFDTETFLSDFANVKNALWSMEAVNACVSVNAQPFVHLYSLWSLLAVNRVSEEAAKEFAPRYARFMEQVASYDLGSEADVESDFDLDEADQRVAVEDDSDLERSDAELLEQIGGSESLEVVRYKMNSVGASTESPQRRARLRSLQSVFDSTENEG